MPIQFPTGVYAQFSPSYLDAKSTISMFVRVRFDTLGSKNYVFQHRLATSGDQLSLRYDSSGGKFIYSTTHGTVRTCTGTTTITAGTVYDVGLVWKQNTADGIRLYVNGVLENDEPTTGQTDSNYNTSGGTFWIARSAAGDTSEYGRCTIEKLILYPDKELSAEEFQLIARIWPHQLVSRFRASLFLPMFFFDEDNGKIADWSGNNRDVVVFNGTPITETPRLGKWGSMRIGRRWGSLVHAEGSAPPPGPDPPNPWEEVTPAVDHPNSAKPVTGLTNGTTYEFKVVAFDASGNQSVDSEVVEATPTAPAPTVSTLQVPWIRLNRFSKYRPSQQE